MTKTIRYISLFNKMSRRRKWLLMKASLYSLWAEIFVQFNMNYLLRRSAKNEDEAADHTPEQMRIIRDVGRVSRILGERAPWDPLCLNLAYVTKKILREYGIESTFRLGYLEGLPKEKMEGHAWITIGGRLVTGWLPTLGDYVEMSHPEQRKSIVFQS